MRKGESNYVCKKVKFGLRLGTLHAYDAALLFCFVKNTFVAIRNFLLK